MKRLFALLVSCMCPLLLAAEDYTVQLEMKDGDMIPLEIVVPAKTKIRIEITNTGNSAVEFESTQLRKEKVLAPGNSSVVVLRPLRPGEYTFFDDWHLDKPHGKIIAKEDFDPDVDGNKNIDQENVSGDK